MPTSTAADERYGVLLGATSPGDHEPAPLEAVGGKGAQTAQLLAAGLPVPTTAVVTVEAYRSVAADPAVATIVGRIRAGEVVEAPEVDAAFRDAAMPAEVAAAIVDLGAEVAAGGRLAVRSSATVEDLGGTSFAGQYRSVLDVEPGPDLLVAVRQVWASLWHPAPCAYRRVNRIDDRDAAMAVVLMAMVPAVQAGVVFTVDPADGAGHVRVEAVDGYGESLVAGTVTPRCWSLPRDGAASAPVPIGEAAALALAAESAFGVPLDVEWSWDGAHCWLVQARPITVPAPGDDGFDTPLDDHELTTAGIAEMLPGVLPPLVWQLAGTAVEEAIRASFDALGVLDGELAPSHALVRRVRARAALDLDALSGLASRLPGGSAEAIEHGFFGRGDMPPAAPRAGWLRGVRHDIRVDAARRRARHDAAIVVDAAGRLAASGPVLADLDDSAILGYRRRLVDLGFRAMAAEVGVAAAATAAYDRLQTFLAGHLTPDDARRWVQRLTAGVGPPGAEPAASMSVFTGPSWDEVGIPPPAARRSDRLTAGAPGRDDLSELEALLQALPRWRATRILTGQVVDVRIHLLRRLTAEARTLLDWRERTKAAVLTVGGLVRATHRALGRRYAERGALEDPDDVDLLSDAELRGAAPVPAPGVLARRRRALAAATAGGSLPERFTGVPPRQPAPMPPGDRLEGIAASAGRCTARARVIRDPRGGRLRAGEVLVAESTDAGWSPLFARAGAIVVERGGELSHAAIVARELGVPAVLDVHGATAALDGRIVTVDGDAGAVVLHGRGQRP